MKTFFPQSGSEAEWNAAYYRLEDYLRALHVTNKVHQSQIILELVRRASRRHQIAPEESPTGLIIQEAQDAMAEWFAAILQCPDRFRVVGLVSLFATESQEKWPAVFLSDVIPPEFQKALRDNEVRAGPELQVSRMVPRPLDVSPVVEVIFQDGWEKLEAGTAVLAFAAFGALATLFFLFAR